MVVVVAPALEVDGEARGPGQGFDQVGEHLGAEGSDPIGPQLQVDHGVGPAAHIHRRSSQRLVHGNRGVAETVDAGAVGQGRGQRASQDQGGVFDRVMVVHLQITLGGDGQIDQGVVGERGEEVIEEADSGGDLGAPVTVEIQGHRHGGLGGDALEGGSAGHGRLLSRAAARR